jgi:hypothetical protein
MADRLPVDGKSDRCVQGLRTDFQHQHVDAGFERHELWQR